MKSNLPDSFKGYFWDVDFNSLSFSANELKLSTNKQGFSVNKSFILKRLLDRGNTEAINWVKENYNRKEIGELLLTTRDISQKTANFWADFLELDRQKVPCLQKPYTRIPFGLSS